MEVQTVIQSVEQQPGSDWFRVKAADGTRYDTKRGEIAYQAQQLIGTPAIISFTERQSDRINGHTGLPYVNRYLDAVRGGPPVSPQQPPASGFPSSVPQSGFTPGPQTASDDKGARMGRSALAAAVAPELVKQVEKGAGYGAVVQALLDGLFHWAETGQPIFAPAQPAPQTLEQEIFAGTSGAQNTDDIPF